MRLKLKTIALLILMIIFVINTSGCIDINWAKGYLGDEPPPVKHRIVMKWQLDYYFQAGPHTDEMPIHVLDDTKWVKINMSINLEQSIGLVRQITVVVYEPGEELGEFNEHFSKKYNGTTDDSLFIDNPKAGEWRFVIDGQGFAVGDLLQDSYHVEVSAFEVDRRS